VPPPTKPSGTITQVAKKTHNTPSSSSKAWKVFIKVLDKAGHPTERAVCTVCGVDRSVKGGNTTGMLQHLDSGDCYKKKMGSQVVLPLKAKKKPNAQWQKEMAVEFAVACAMDYRPLSMGEGAGMRRFFAKLYPDFTPPSHHTVNQHLRSCMLLIDDKVSVFNCDHHQQIRERLKTVDYIAATTDGWTSREDDRFVSLTLHYIDDDWKLCEVLAAVAHLPGCTAFAHQ
jgi:hypothetical protein